MPGSRGPAPLRTTCGPATGWLPLESVNAVNVCRSSQTLTLQDRRHSKDATRPQIVSDEGGKGAGVDRFRNVAVATGGYGVLLIPSHGIRSQQAREAYRRAALSRPNARNMAPSTALWTTNAVATLPTNVAPITIASIVLSSPQFHSSCRRHRPQFCLLLMCAQAAACVDGRNGQIW